jgi:hypothetical protein
MGGAHLKKLCRAEGGAKILGVFRVKNHDFTPKNHIFSNLRERGARRVRPLDPPLDKDEPNIVFKRKSYRTSQHGTQNLKTHNRTA